MSILIRGMEMPKSCGVCRFAGVCGVLPEDEWPDIESIVMNDVIGVDGARGKDCPLVPVPSHGRLIDADELRYWKDDSALIAFDYVTRSQIKAAPTIIQAEPYNNISKPCNTEEAE